jgi:hypothetical protein
MTATLKNQLDSLEGWHEHPIERSEVSHSGGPKLPAVQHVPMRRFLAHSGIVESAKSIQVLLSPGEEGIIAEIDALQLVAAGADVSEAVTELSEQLVYFFRYYSSLRNDQVTGLAMRLREIYRTQFHEQEYRIA